MQGGIKQDFSEGKIVKTEGEAHLYIRDENSFAGIYKDFKDE